MAHWEKEEGDDVSVRKNKTGILIIIKDFTPDGQSASPSGHIVVTRTRWASYLGVERLVGGLLVGWDTICICHCMQFEDLDLVGVVGAQLGWGNINVGSSAFHHHGANKIDSD